MKQTLERLDELRRRLSFFALITAILFLGLIVAAFLKPLLATVLGAVNVLIYLALVRPTYKAYNELFIRENILHGLGAKVQDKTYFEKPGVDTERFHEPHIFPSTLSVNAPLFTRELTGRLKVGKDPCEISISQVTFNYRRQNKRPNVFLCGAWVELQLPETQRCGIDWVLISAGVPDTRFTELDYVSDGWKKQLSEQGADGFSLYVPEDVKDAQVFSETVIKLWKMLCASVMGKAAMSMKDGRLIVFLPGCFYTVNIPLQFEAAEEDIRTDRLPELDHVIRIAAELCGI